MSSSQREPRSAIRHYSLARHADLPLFILPVSVNGDHEQHRMCATMIATAIIAADAYPARSSACLSKTNSKLDRSPTLPVKCSPREKSDRSCHTVVSTTWASSSPSEYQFGKQIRRIDLNLNSNRFWVRIKIEIRDAGMRSAIFADLFAASNCLAAVNARARVLAASCPCAAVHGETSTVLFSLRSTHVCTE